MKETKETKKSSITTSTILLLIFAVILVIFVIKIVSSNNNSTETSKQVSNSKSQVSTSTSLKEETKTEEAQNTIEKAVEETKTEEYVEKLDDGTKVNKSDKVNQTKKLSNFEISDVQLTSNNGISTLLASVKNTSSNKTSETEITIQILDKNGSVITDFIGVINELEPGATTTLNASVTADVSNAYDFKILEK